MSKFQECLDSLKLTKVERTRLASAHSATLTERCQQEYERGVRRGQEVTSYRLGGEREKIKAELLDAIARSVLGELFYDKLVKMLDDTRDCDC